MSRADYELDASRALKSFIRRTTDEAQIRSDELNALVDAAADLNWRVGKDQRIDVFTQAIKGWLRACQRESAPNVYLGRIFVFSRHEWVTSEFLAGLASHLARHCDGQFAEDRWIRLAMRLANGGNVYGSNVFRDRLRLAIEPFRRADRERIRALKAMREQQSYQHLLSEIDRKLQRAAAWEAMAILIQQIRSTRFETVYQVPLVIESDTALCAVWAGQPVETATRIRDHHELETLIGPNEANRLLSARLAERVTAEFYKTMGHVVRDTSIEQLTGTSVLWKTHDLEADGDALDVKNARRSFSSPSAYSEWCINRYKMVDRVGGKQDVRLVGVLSDYVPVSRMDDMMGRAEVTVLGETTRSKIAQIARWAHSMTAGRLDIVDPDGTRFLAGWCFDYPDRYYEMLPDVLLDLPLRVQELERSGVEASEIPLLIRLMVGIPSIDACGTRLRLTSLREDVGFSRMSAVAFSLVEMILAAHGDETAQPLAISSAVFPTGRHGPLLSYPLLRYDPEQQVASMVEAIRRVWTSSKAHLMNFHRFRISGTGIFQGAGVKGAWVTILAYCGGWRRYPTIARCGTSPLSMSTDETCAKCLHLICRNCGYCGASCPDCEPRQEILADSQ